MAYVFIKEAEEMAKRLKPLQKADGKWIDVATTSVIVRLLIRLRKNMAKPIEETDEMIFNGMLYIREQLSDSKAYWGNKVSETAKALIAWHDFDSLISGFPIEEVVGSIQTSENVQKNITAIDSAINLIRSLRIEATEARRLRVRERTLTKVSVSGLVISAISIVSLLFLLWYIVSKGLGLDAATTIQEWIGLRGWVITFIGGVMLLVIYILNKYRLLPKRVRSAAKMIASVLRLPFPEDEKATKESSEKK
jgi:hypothetical protein